MIDKSAIDAIAKSEAVTAVHSAVTGAMASNGLIGLPDNFDVHDLEKYMDKPRRFSGSMTTTDLEAFVGYLERNSTKGLASVFVEETEMRAKAILDLGTSENFGHAWHRASFTPVVTPEYASLTYTSTASLTQKILAEWLEDFADCVGIITDLDGKKMTTAQAASIIRSVTIESLAKSTTEEGQLSSERSEFESIKADSSKGRLPAFISFNCKPYRDLSTRCFNMRLSITTGDRTPRLSLKVIRMETHQHEMAQELNNIVSAAVSSVCPGMPVNIGSFSK